jgi:hypothetical protein
MVKSYLMTDQGERRDPPDIFRAARNDDVRELFLSIQNGQSLNDQEYETGYTPVHLACMAKSSSFMDACLDLDFDPWIRDSASRIAFLYAWASSFPEGQKILFDKMYPPGWEREAEVTPFPGPA